MSLHLKLLDIDYPLTFEESKLRKIEAHALIYLRISLLIAGTTSTKSLSSLTGRKLRLYLKQHH